MVDEPLIHATTYIPLMDNADSNPVVDKREVIDLIKPDQVEVIQKTGAKKLKIETDKGNVYRVQQPAVLKTHIFEFLWNECFFS